MIVWIVQERLNARMGRDGDQIVAHFRAFVSIRHAHHVVQPLKRKIWMRLSRHECLEQVDVGFRPIGPVHRLLCDDIPQPCDRLVQIAP
jgi:hypothetical protein